MLCARAFGTGAKSGGRGLGRPCAEGAQGMGAGKGPMATPAPVASAASGARRARAGRAFARGLNLGYPGPGRKLLLQSAHEGGKFIL